MTSKRFRRTCTQGEIFLAFFLFIVLQILYLDSFFLFSSLMSQSETKSEPTAEEEDKKAEKDKEPVEQTDDKNEDDEDQEVLCRRVCLFIRSVFEFLRLFCTDRRNSSCSFRGSQKEKEKEAQEEETCRQCFWFAGLLLVCLCWLLASDPLCSPCALIRAFIECLDCFCIG